MKKLMIYGATGYMGRMAAKYAAAQGLDIVVAGRNQDRLRTLAAQLNVPYRIFTPDALTPETLNGVAVLLNFAGPFAQTAKALMQSCINAGVDYLDITAEIKVYELAEQLGAEAAESGVMLIPGVGWDVVPTDCLAVHAAHRVHAPQSIKIALQVAGTISRGSALSISEIVSAGLLARIDGSLVATPAAQPKSFDFGDGPKLCAPLSFGDLITTWHSTGIPNISMFVHFSGDPIPEGDISMLPEGPDAQQREAHRARAVAEVTGGDGTVARSIIETVNGYTYTPLAAVEAARRVLAGERRLGFETPAKLLGTGFAESIAGTTITDL
ncbi:saccharopine dehydrogenase family protein [Pseudomonas sp. CNPSo 3701]|uniref:saccharopine dehydrogenase family protein n=1 Tax=Pseudomonas sp. CNPSo 3701 TaxID=3027943 RepID=UPI00236347D0|nr:saccharopine dehydrogenase NADP-binding domain-containing protein [Pseudomonas sp. CNPSo 3701]MDD1507709.1 saccharopine dehydrogenase NADP-binding domain-containing protein [Pseudomonas sp. CNPSo 3701]